jgi:hypothetical protein
VKVFKNAILRRKLYLTRGNVTRDWRSYKFRNFIIYTLRKILGDGTEDGRWGGHAALVG